MNRSPYLFIVGGFLFLAAAFFIPAWIYSKNPLFMVRGDLDADQVAMVADFISDNYVVSVDRVELMHDAVSGMTDKLDIWSDFIKADSAADRDIEQLKGNYGGIGVHLQRGENNIWVRKVFEGGPAYKAGVLAGDEFYSVDGVDVSSTNRSDVLQELVMGKKGTKVTIKFYRDSIQDFVTKEIIRDTIDYPSVDSELLEGKILYLKLNIFHAKSAAQLEEHLMKYKNIEGIVFDLRDNGGGVLESAIQIANHFLPKDTLVVTVKSRKETMPHKTTEDGKWKKIPIIVLINRRSASASEVVVGALQDHKRATIWGEKSYGKALVQQVYPLEGGKSKIKLTIARYMTPNGHFIQRTDKKPYGITPDREVEDDPLSQEYYRKVMKQTWDKLGIKKDFEEFLKENPPAKELEYPVDKITEEARQELLKIKK